MRCTRFAIVLLLATATPLRADDAADPRALEADPDRPRISLFYRGALRGTLGLRLPLFGARPGWSAHLTPMIELHEPPGSDQPLPNQHWRGLLSAGVEHGWGERERYRLGLGIAHESDHETAHEFSAPGFLALNLFELPAGASFDLGLLELGASATPRLYVLSCTRLAAPCEDLEGSTALGGQLGINLRVPTPLLFGLQPFAALAASGILGSGQVHDERRLALRGGVYLEVAHGTLELYLLGFFGHDVGVTRDDELSQLGGGVAWTLDLVEPR
ncbi:MAG: hypothetical protein OXT09_07750 [Myxococcales bacterium]|nr:hypothetical protein [Myxococcales bacterium]